jgi:hypothetical protein
MKVSLVVKANDQVAFRVRITIQKEGVENAERVL